MRNRPIIYGDRLDCELKNVRACASRDQWRFKRGLRMSKRVDILERYRTKQWMKAR